jgi:uncharacterized protein (TIGR02284 family)
VTTQETIDRLNELVRVCKDGEHGYLTAAGDVKNTELETLFLESSMQRAGYARELQAEIERLGGLAVDSGTLSAAVHRGWMNLKAEVSNGDSAGIVAACETGEDSAQAAFERAVNAGLSGKTLLIVEKQWHKIEEAHTRLVRIKQEAADGGNYPRNE